MGCSEMNEINERQLEILRNALNWPLYNRNYYISCRECDSFNDCEQLVGAGLMERMRSESLLLADSTSKCTTESKEGTVKNQVGLRLLKPKPTGASRCPTIILPNPIVA